MTSCLELLREGGRLHVRVPYDLSHGAWQDPTHVRGFNERSWLYYTDWFWYLGWTEARFDLEEMEFLPSPWGKELIAKGMLETDLCRQPRAIDEIRVVLRKRTLSPEESKIADGFLRRRELDGSQSVHPFPHAHPPEPGSQKRKSPPPAPIQKKGQSYYTGLNQRLLRSVPPTAHEILEVGCAEGRLGEALRSAQQGRRVYGIEREPAIAARAEARLDKVFCLDVEKEVPDLPLGSLDALLFGDVLEHLHAPLDVLRRYAPLLKPSGHALCCIPNVQHHSVLAPLIRGEFQYRDQGLLDSSHYRFFTWASFTKLMLDAGFAPTIRDAVSVPISQPLLEAFRPLFDHLGVEQERMEHYVSTYQWIFEGRPLGWDEDFPEIPLSFVACVNNEAQLSENLAASPCFQESGAHELILIRGAQSASEGFCAGIERAQHEVVVFLHQDVYLPKNWPRRFAQQWLLASERFGGMGVAGVYGACHDNAVQGGVLRTGHVVDRHTLLNEPRPLPACVETLDEVLLAIPRSTPLRPDPALGFHLYGADLALQARKAGLSCVALDAPCFHNSVTGSRLPPAYQHSAEVLRGQWSGCLPIATPCALIH
jgi:SAM-dependent methyltransferase